MKEQVYTFCLPDIGEGVVEGEVVEWLKMVGDPVRQDEPVVTVMTDKATVELPAPYPGKIVKQYYRPGEVAIKDKPLYDIQLESDIPLVQKEENHTEVKPSITAATKESLPKRAGKALATPKVRHLAREWNIDLEAISGTGKEGRITEQDLHNYLGNPRVAPHTELEGDEEQQLTGIRGLMARKMDQTHIPQFSYFEQADVSRLIEMRDKFREKAASENISLSYMPFFIRALSLAIKKYPQMNASLNMSENKIVIHKQQNIGIAMATKQGLIVPVLKGVEAMGLNEVIRAYEAFKAKAVEGKLSSEEMKGATITISNFGVLGGDGLWATPLISDPEVAILAIGRIRKMPVAKNEDIIIKDVVPLSWSFDHRLIDGELAAQISHDYCVLLRNPASLL